MYTQTLHSEILAEIVRHKGKGTSHTGKYAGSTFVYYGVSVPLKRTIVKQFLKDHPSLSYGECVRLLSSLYAGASHEEKTIASMLLSTRADVRKNVPLSLIWKWLGQLVGWAEVDGLCQNMFSADEVLLRWHEWQPFLQKLARDKNIQRRRASLVFLTGPVTYSKEERLRNCAFERIEELKSEKEILITKAISWLLRSMVYQHKKAVAGYIAREKETLPKIAVRETTRKIKTGRK